MIQNDWFVDTYIECLGRNFEPPLEVKEATPGKLLYLLIFNKTNKGFGLLNQQ
jgi:hypothetical protein